MSNPDPVPDWVSNRRHKTSGLSLWPATYLLIAVLPLSAMVYFFGSSTRPAEQPVAKAGAPPKTPPPKVPSPEARPDPTQQRSEPAPLRSEPVAQSDPVRQAIDAYLRDSLGDPDYEVVRWISTCNLQGSKVFQDPFGGDLRVDQDALRKYYSNTWHEIDKPGKAVRLKYRVKIGPIKTVREHVFLVSGSNVIPVDPQDFTPPKGEAEKWGESP